MDSDLSSDEDSIIRNKIKYGYRAREIKLKFVRQDKCKNIIKYGTKYNIVTVLARLNLKICISG